MLIQRQNRRGEFRAMTNASTIRAEAVDEYSTRVTFTGLDPKTADPLTFRLVLTVHEIAFIARTHASRVANLIAIPLRGD